jgi:hypothetical protein
LARTAIALVGSVLLAVALAGFGSGQLARAGGAGCGTDRPDVGTLTDANAGSVDTSQIIGAHISTLAAVPIPDDLPANARFNPYETTVWSTIGNLVKAQIGPGQAIDVTLADPTTGDTFMAVFPDAARCAQGADPSLLQLMEQARQTFVQAFGTPSSDGMTLNGTASVIGVGFISAATETGQGGSGSGIEIYPVLDFEIAPGTVPSAAPATGTPVSTPSPETAATPQPQMAPAQRTPAPAHLYYVDTAALSATIYCDSDPALLRTGRRTLRVFRSFDLAIEAYPNYRLNRPC